MFCPLGYVPLSKLIDRIPARNFHRTYEAYVEKFANDAKYALSVSVSDFLEVDIWAILDDQVFACSPGSVIMKLDFRQFRSDDFTVGDLQRIETLEGASLPHSIYDSLNLNSPIDLNDFKRDAREKGIGYWELSKDWGIQEKHFVVPLFYERQCYTISLIGYDELSKIDFLELDRCQPALSVARQLSGWSLCVTEEFANDAWEAAWSRRDQTPSSSSTGGRPPILRLEAIEAYKTLFPNGHEGQSWPTVARAINNYADRSMSIDTVKRAVKGSRFADTPRQN